MFVENEGGFYMKNLKLILTQHTRIKTAKRKILYPRKHFKQNTGNPGGKFRPEDKDFNKYHSLS